MFIRCNYKIDTFARTFKEINHIISAKVVQQSLHLDNVGNLDSLETNSI